MSLIPSESLNFPDSFRANVGWRLDDVDDQQETGSPRQVAVDNHFPTPVEMPKAVVQPPASASFFSLKPPEAVAPSPEPQNVLDDDQQLDLNPNMPTEANGADSAPEPGEMNALLQYFLAAGALPAAASDRPNGQSAVHAEDVATVEAVIPSNVPVESSITAAPNEPSIVMPVKVEPVSSSPSSEPMKESPIPENPSSPQQSIVAALQSLSHADVEPPIGSVEIQTPAQANHIMELIAAAVQRGSLVGETIPQSNEPVAQPTVTEPAASPVTPAPAPAAAPVSGFSIVGKPAPKSTAIPPRTPEPIFSIPVLPEPPPVAEPASTVPEPPAPLQPTIPNKPKLPAAETVVAPAQHAPIDSSGPVTSTQHVAKVPAKIRITPRKIKPRPQPQPISDEPTSSAKASEESPAEDLPEVKVTPVLNRRAEAPVEPKTKSAPKSLELPEVLAPLPELSARKIAAARLELAQSDPFLFNARERRNRWIGFGLSELAVVTALVLLCRFAFTHHFPDPTLKILVFILVFAAAAVAIALPIAFLRNDPQRWGRVSR